MSILIKGMEMPKSCMLCPFCVEEADPANGEMCMVTGKLMPPCTRVRLDDCPLVPVPPHGRLIDADAYESLLRGIGSREYRREKGTICDAIKFLHPHYAPTIIPAEPAEEGET